MEASGDPPPMGRTRRRIGGDGRAVKQERSRGPRDEGGDDSTNSEGSLVGMGAGLASARRVRRGGMRVGFRPGPAGGEERCEAKGRGQKATGDEEGRRQKAKAKK